MFCQLCHTALYHVEVFKYGDGNRRVFKNDENLLLTSYRSTVLTGTDFSLSLSLSLSLSPSDIARKVTGSVVTTG